MPPLYKSPISSPSSGLHPDASVINLPISSSFWSVFAFFSFRCWSGDFRRSQPHTRWGGADAVSRVRRMYGVGKLRRWRWRSWERSRRWRSGRGKAFEEVCVELRWWNHSWYGCGSKDASEGTVDSSNVYVTIWESWFERSSLTVKPPFTDLKRRTTLIRYTSLYKEKVCVMVNWRLPSSLCLKVLQTDQPIGGWMDGHALIWSCGSRPKIMHWFLIGVGMSCSFLISLRWFTCSDPVSRIPTIQRLWLRVARNRSRIATTFPRIETPQWFWLINYQWLPTYHLSIINTYILWIITANRGFSDFTHTKESKLTCARQAGFFLPIHAIVLLSRALGLIVLCTYQYEEKSVFS